MGDSFDDILQSIESTNYQICFVIGNFSDLIDLS